MEKRAEVASIVDFDGMVSGRRRGAWPALARLGLSILSLPYAIAVRLRNSAFERGFLQSYAAQIPVVSIGNLTLGGTGKTPAVEYVARYYREQDRRVAILSRGYGARAGRNDEALVLESLLPDVPHLQGKDRVALARMAWEELESEILVLDDGFQHRRLRRNLDVVLIDATNPWGYGWIFPRGLLREPKGGLRRAQLALLTRCDQVSPEQLARLRVEVRNIAPGLPMTESRHVPQRLVNAEAAEADLDAIAGKPVGAFCGIGNPEGFRRTLVDLGAHVQAWRVFPDHHPYHANDVDELRQWARELPGEAWLLTTQKDLVKVGVTQLGGRPLWAVRIALELTEGQEVFLALLKGVIA